MEHYFVACGMPHDAVALSLRQAERRGGISRTEKGFVPFRSWLINDGRSTYLSFLATHPGWDVAKPFDQRDAFLAPQVLGYAGAFDNKPVGIFRVVGAAAVSGFSHSGDGLASSLRVTRALRAVAAAQAAGVVLAVAAMVCSRRARLPRRVLRRRDRAQPAQHDGSCGAPAVLVVGDAVVDRPRRCDSAATVRRLA